jgi:hypothetical protein
MSIELTDAQSLAISNAAAALCPTDRDQFYQAVARQLAGREIGDGAVHRAVAVAFQAFWRPSDITTMRVPSRWNRAEPRFDHASKR